ncbi:hypothetical protein J2Z21_008756 [Streptomyces griseochromogenes]|uniref:Rieske domain-containing protein n=1 Tax=Streptomyces griseochromogenes TaxID=68214 RepID=A0ABS4M7T6_9ACTN|nr:hypothetical protein [Streptomyces griseochromogenes]
MRRPYKDMAPLPLYHARCNGRNGWVNDSRLPNHHSDEGPFLAVFRDHLFCVRGTERTGVALAKSRPQLGRARCPFKGSLSLLLGPRPQQKPVGQTTATTANLPEAVQENEEVVPVNVSTWVLPSGVTVGR